MTSAETSEVDPENGTLHVDGTRDSSEVDWQRLQSSIETTAVDNNVNPMPTPPCE